MLSVPYLAQTTAGGCGACCFIMVARYFKADLALTEDEALQQFGVDGYGPRCFDLATGFIKAAVAVGLVARISALRREELRAHLATGPVIVYHKASEASDALSHFSVALDATAQEVRRHDPGIGAGVVDAWEQFETLWRAAKVSWWPHDGCYAAVLRPTS